MTDFIMAHWLDITTTVLGLAYILLEYKASVWMWLIGFLMQALGIVLYYRKGLYADCGMEFYYLAMTLYGWWRWIRGSAARQELPVRHFPRRLVLLWLLLAVIIWGIIYWLLVSYTNSNVPLADSFTTALSIMGIWALAHKYLEQILLLLRQAGFITAQKGLRGGYTMACSPEKVTLSDVLNALDMNILAEMDPKDEEGGLRPVINDCFWERINSSLNQFTSGVTLRAFAEQCMDRAQKNWDLYVI